MMDCHMVVGWGSQIRPVLRPVLHPVANIHSEVLAGRELDKGPGKANSPLAVGHQVGETCFQNVAEAEIGS